MPEKKTEIASQQEGGKQQALPVIASPQDTRGVYSNIAVVKHTEREFVFDFILQLDDRAQLVARIITSPEHAKAISEVLRENIEAYEKKQKG